LDKRIGEQSEFLVNLDGFRYNIKKNGEAIQWEYQRKKNAQSVGQKIRYGLV